MERRKIFFYLKKLLVPVSIMIIPHTRSRPKTLKVPALMVFLFLAIFLVGVIYTFSTAVSTYEYRRMKRTVNHYENELRKVSSTIKSLKKAEDELSRLLSIKSKNRILEELDVASENSVDLEAIKREIEGVVERYEEIRTFLRKERDRYLSTPKGWPVPGRITSGFGIRPHPLRNEETFHTGIDINVPPGTPVRATADGIVVYSGWSFGNGNVVVIEHGNSYSTVYAHNSKNLVVVGQRIKRGDVIALSGTTGETTGPHLHYEVWVNRKPVNPEKFLRGETDVSQK